MTGVTEKNCLLEARGVTKFFGSGAARTEVLRGVDLRLEEGEMAVMVGASGAGKSTLLYSLSSLEPPSGGTVLYRGQDVYRQTEKELGIFRNQEIGFVFQFHHLLPEFNAVENVMMPLLIRGISSDEARDQAADVMGRVGLQAKTAARPAELSGGEQQRVAVARAIVTQPRLLFADEPTGNLDHENGEHLFSLLEELNRKDQITCLIVTHNQELAKRIPRRLELEDGRILKS